jgi:hypothetical protein
MTKSLIAISLLLVAVETAAARPAPEGPLVRDTAAAQDLGRPERLTFGIGIGYRFPTSLEAPNVTSVRVRFASGLTLEPQLRLAMLANDYGGMRMDQRTTSTALGISTVGRLPLITRRKFELEAIGSVGFTHTKLYQSPISSEPDRTTTFSLGWGVGVSYWLNTHWNLSLTATNPLASYTKLTPNTSTTTLGVIFDPEVAAMIHVFN